MTFNKKRIILLFLLPVVLLPGCETVDKFNARINTPIREKDLKSDVEYIEHKLEKLEPDLYHFISRKDLEYKFDSLKATLNAPMTGNEFYFRLSPVIASIKQGHTQTIPATKRLKPAEKKSAKGHGLTPLAHYEYELFDNKLYVVKNNSSDPRIKAGTEVVSLNGVKPQEIIDKYRNTFTSDGSNTTFTNRKYGTMFARFFYYRYGLTDSVSVELNYKDTVRSIVVYRTEKAKKTVLKKTVQKKTKEELKKDRRLQAEEGRKRRLLGYDPIRRMYSKLLTFPVKDSSVAIMKISDFMLGNYKKFYKQSFRLLDSLHTKTLILDVRDNGGGHISDINKLYSYLADSSFHLVDKSEVTSRTSLWHIGYYHDQPLWVQFIQTALLPIVAGVDLYTFLKTEKGQDHKYYFSFKESKLTKPQPNRFKGKVYVLINGGCFSATCLLSSHLKGSERATFVGEETGGSYNGCVAGILPVTTLPASKVRVRYGLLSIKTPYTSAVDGRGIFPNVEIEPTIEDRLEGNDLELQWVLNDIKGLKQDSKETIQTTKAQENTKE